MGLANESETTMANQAIPTDVMSAMRELTGKRRILRESIQDILAKTNSFFLLSSFVTRRLQQEMNPCLRRALQDGNVVVLRQAMQNVREGL